MCWSQIASKSIKPDMKKKKRDIILKMHVKWYNDRLIVKGYMRDQAIDCKKISLHILEYILLKFLSL